MGWAALRRRLSRALGRWLRRWSDFFYTLAGEDAPPPDWPDRSRSGPPAAWLERVRALSPGEPPADFFDNAPPRREPAPPARSQPEPIRPAPRLAFRYHSATPSGGRPSSRPAASQERRPAVGLVWLPPVANSHTGAGYAVPAAAPVPAPRRPLVEEARASRPPAMPGPVAATGPVEPTPYGRPPADSWPSLPPAPPAESEPVEEAARRREWQRRLDEEQRGGGWSASPF
jgi:hypothetical protein